MANQMGEASEGRTSGKGKPLNSIDHKQSKPVKVWVKNELKQQQKRFKKISVVFLVNFVNIFNENHVFLGSS